MICNSRLQLSSELFYACSFYCTYDLYKLMYCWGRRVNHEIPPTYTRPFRYDKVYEVYNASCIIITVGQQILLRIRNISQIKGTANTHCFYCMCMTLYKIHRRLTVE